MESHRIFIRLVIAFYLIHVLGGLVQNGMFLDGVTYGAISRNLSHGLGTYWDLHYTKTLAPHFHDHPSFAFILQSIFFKALGDSFYTERIYSFVLSLLWIAGVVLCWNTQVKDDRERNSSWLPVLLWLSMPLAGWSIRNNLLENTMGLFSLFAVYGGIRAMLSRNVLFLLFSGLLILLAFLSKGFAGFFPLITPLVFGFCHSDRKFGIIYTFYLLGMIIGLSGLSFWIWPEMWESIMTYINQQVLPSIQHKREVTTETHLMLLWRLLGELVFPMTILLLLRVFCVKVKWSAFKISNPRFLFFLGIAICASIPLMFILKQRRFYLGPSLPFYALAFSVLAYPLIKELLSRITPRFMIRMNYVSWIILAGAIMFVYTRVDLVGRDQEKLEDIAVITAIVKEGSVVTASAELCTDWSLVAYMSRFGYISLDEQPGHEYLLFEKSKVQEMPGYSAIPIALHRYVLFKKNVQN